ncbi:ATP-dependent helicase HrpB [Marivirga tractuosa]|uniref:ATP-dependent helicase HrpB n=1 Tax=Marivirga tractuosa (strain ATCC 23168 / DSM 4126 / NBRC 15989 / NCIMB 1408 / VKM B-1430 / H-43) TaxID=643867 RepID=E4TL76_MARTH|nr:ATP-dependent helicase HrpB [Marivirga tractuosa]ADR20214.1 ATP-dependent helicase HrpB [Marivirga tractuosa DSM 4126]BDD15345.1 ATP-dependent helicase HrpB [Marivirga tractuosa]
MPKIDLSQINLPIVDILPEVLQKIKEEQNLILNAEAGAGKSTIIPLALLELFNSKRQKIIMLEPRRLAAKSIAQRMSQLIGEEVGNTIGYRIRFETRISENTQIEVVTEGILNKMMDSDPELKEVAIVIFDEFHERSIHADVALALARYTQQNSRPDLKLLIMSATLNQQLLATELKAKVIASKGRQYPVDIEYAGNLDQRLIAELTAEQVKKALKDDKGDILVFLPGQGEILAVQDLLRKSKVKAEIYPLFGQLAWHKQWAAIQPHPQGKRKIVLATSIAETSLTIEGIKVVIDTGLKKNSIFDPNTALNSLKTQAISQDEATQRAGRAGRLAPGKCYRMWTEIEQNNKSSHRLAEILHADLASLKLDLAARNIHESKRLFWLTPPPLDKLIYAENLLIQLEALDDNKSITETGKQMHQLPCHPRLAHMLVKSTENLSLAIDLASLLEEKDPLYKKAGADISERIQLLRILRGEKRLGRNFKKIEKIAQAYRVLFKIDEDNKEVDPYSIGFLLAMAYPDRIASAKRGNNAQFQLSNGSIAAIGHKDELADESWLTVANMDARAGMGKIFLAAPLNPKDLMPLLKNRRNVRWDFDEDEFIVSQDLSIGNIRLKSEELDEEPDSAEKRKAIIRAIQLHYDEILNPIADFLNFLEEIKETNLETEYADMDLAYLGITAEKWLPEGIENEENIVKCIHELSFSDVLKNLINRSHY